MPVRAGAQRDDSHRRKPPTPARWLGCYELRVGRWSPAIESGYELPDTIRLDTVPVAGTSPGRRPWYAVQATMPAFVARRALLGVVGWRPVGADSVALRWFDGFVRIAARLGARGDSLAGVARWERVTAQLDSAGHPRPTRTARAPLIAARLACPSSR